MLKEKITADHNTIKDGLELLKFYKERNKYFTAFDKEIEDLDTLRLDQNKTKFVATSINIDCNNITVDDLNILNKKKCWSVYFDGELKSDKPDTLNKAILFAKSCMFYGKYNEVIIKIKK